MKKLMCAAAALIAGVAVADVTSANIVGYANGDLREGNTLASAQFVTIGGAEVDLQTVKPIGDDTSDNVFLSVLDEYGFTSEMYTWVNWAGDTYDQEAWIDSSYVIAEKSFPAGQGFWIQGKSGQKIQTAGEVGSSDVIVELREGNTAVGNPFPLPVNLQEILPSGDGISDNVFLSILDEYGFTSEMYTWVDWAGDTFDQEAWINSSYEIADVTFPAGQGFWIQGKTGQSIRFVAPEL